MKIIVGLGNPGTKYATTRHNVGFLAIDHFLKQYKAITCTSKFESQLCELHLSVPNGLTKIFLVKPQTYMNNSGHAVSEILHFYKINIATELLIVHDEIDLPFGTVKQSFNSRAAGHNGVQNIIDSLSTQEFNRIRVGIEARQQKTNSPTDEFVLQNFSSLELTALEETIFPTVQTYIENFIFPKNKTA